jgi:hypothetical protein
MTESQVRAVLTDNGVTGPEADALVADYTSAQINAIKEAILLSALLAGIGLLIAQRLPRVPGVELGAEEETSPAPV